MIASIFSKMRVLPQGDFTQIRCMIDLRKSGLANYSGHYFVILRANIGKQYCYRKLRSEGK